MIYRVLPVPRPQQGRNSRPNREAYNRSAPEDIQPRVPKARTEDDTRPQWPHRPEKSTARLVRRHHIDSIRIGRNRDHKLALLNRGNPRHSGSSPESLHVNSSRPPRTRPLYTGCCPHNLHCRSKTARKLRIRTLQPCLLRNPRACTLHLEHRIPQ